MTCHCHSSYTYIQRQGHDQDTLKSDLVQSMLKFNKQRCHRNLIWATVLCCVNAALFSVSLGVKGWLHKAGGL